MSVARRDVVDSLREALATLTRSGTADSDVNVFALPVVVPFGVVEHAVAEIERLRSAMKSDGFLTNSSEPSHGALQVEMTTYANPR